MNKIDTSHSPIYYNHSLKLYKGADVGVFKNLFNKFAKMHNKITAEYWFDSISANTIDMFLPCLPKICSAFLTHQANISKSPFAYIKGDKHSISRKSFDLILGGSVGAIADVAFLTGNLAIYTILTLITGVIGILQWGFTLGENTNILKQTCVKFYLTKSIQLTFLEIPVVALRIIPVVGAFIAYGGMILASYPLIKIDEYKRKD